MIMPQMTLRFFYLTTHKVPHASLAGNEHDWKRGYNAHHSVFSGTLSRGYISMSTSQTKLTAPSWLKPGTPLMFPN